MNNKLLAIILFIALISLMVNQVKVIIAQEVEQAPNVGVETYEERSTIFLQRGEEKTYISKPGFNSRHPEMKGDFIVWATSINGEGQIFRYHIPTGSMMQLTSVGTNLNPSVSEDGMVAWEYWDGDGWVVMLYDGLFPRPVSNPVNVAINPYLENGYIAYSVRNPGAEWTARVYSIFGDEKQDVAVGAKYKRPVLNHEIIVFDGEPFLFTIDDLFALQLEPLQNQLEPLPIITAEDILKEVEALILEE